MPKKNVALWRSKFRRTITRDRANLCALAADGWKTLVVWECELHELDEVAQKLRGFLSDEHE